MWGGIWKFSMLNIIKQKVHVHRAYRAMLYMMATIFQLGFQLNKRYDSPWLILVDGVECRNLSKCIEMHCCSYSLSLSIFFFLFLFLNILLGQLFMQSVILVQQCSDSQSWQACRCIHIWSCILQVSFLTLCQSFKIASLAGFSVSLPLCFTVGFELLST